MSPQFINLVNEFYFFNENFINKQDYLVFETYNYLLFLSDSSFYSFLQFSETSSLYTKSIISFINQTEDLNLHNNIENIMTIYHYSIPNTKLAYPEPFIASPSFMHSDLWFMHILVYQYWLWFVFVFIIVFFFITFICTIRWCNMRVRPRRETRGVSRSKCGDLITACVPVTWATSIIVNESTDAIDYYDGFGTTELVVGIRAYQWGWEYYYPKDIDLNYNIKQNYSSFVGNSLKYEHSSDVNLKANNLWKFYQNKTYDQIVTPAHLLALPLDNYKLLNFLNFNDIGSSSIQEANAFKKVRMFSKTHASNLVFAPNTFTQKYKNLSSVFVNDNLFNDSYLYGLKRQHNFLSTKAAFNNQSTFFNLSSVNKIINFNFNSTTNVFSKTNTSQNLNFFRKLNNLKFETNSLRLNPLFNQYFNNTNLNSYGNIVFFNKFMSLINDNSDKKNVHYPIYKLFNLKFKKKIFGNDNNFSLNVVNNSSDLSILTSNTEVSKFFDIDKSYKTATIFSSNQSVSAANRYIRNFIQTAPNQAHYNYSLFLNPINSYLQFSKATSGLTNNFFSDSSNANWIDLYSTQKFSSSKVNFDYPYSPITSNHPVMDTIDYDNLKHSTIEGIPTVLQGKEELMPNFLATIYWNFYWSNSNIDWRFYNSQNYHSIHNLHYMPLFTFYYDYDFRNWQAIELLEDSFWESVYSVYTHDEYTNLADDFYEYAFFDKFSNIFNKFDRLIKYQDRVLEQPLFLDNSSTGESYPNSFYLDDFVSSSDLTLTKDFFAFPLFNVSNVMEESYESLKYLNYFYNLNNKIIFNLFTSSLNSYSSFFVFDSFRSDYDEFSWFIDENSVLHEQFKEISDFIIESDLLGPNLLMNDYLNFLTDKTPFFLSHWLSDLDTTFLNSESDLVESKSNRFSNHVNLRAPAKGSIVTYNAIQKVFRTRFDENRSNTKLADFGYFYNKQPFISSSRPHYEKLLGKTRENFFSINLYKSNFLQFFNNHYSTSTSLNYYFFDFPFLLAMKSDASRYLWFDWFAKWGFYEVQPSSSSRYAIYGMPYLSKNFEFSTTHGESLNESETYLLRLSRARRNYLPNWTYTPYFYAKHTNWYKTNLFYEIFQMQSNSVTGTYRLLNEMSWYWKSVTLLNYCNKQFFPSNSGITSYTKLGWKPQNSIQSYYYSVSSLIDILTKREYLYRELFSLNGKLINLPFYLTNSPSNPLINELKSTFLFTDPVVFNNEYSREIHYNSLKFFNYTILKTFLNNCSNFLNLTSLTDYIFFYFFNEPFIEASNSNNELYKSQYRPLRKGITNMIRLHATGAIAMPIEIRLQVLASSKDVIHSWAIPSAGIKIDCVPGYSSHKVMIFLVSGIFWGQCMEICGRYHHWMPIVIYFMKRDLFFLWCTHFVFLTGNNNMWTINDRQYADYARSASFDKYSWISELNN